MSALFERLREEARKLSPGERRRLGAVLIGMDDEAADSVEEHNERAWDEEILRRVEEIKSGTVEMIPYETVMSELKAKLSKARPSN
jgi:putative addiction module component (TIGR02574 family)